MRDFSIKQCIPTHKLSSQLLYDDKHKTFLINETIIPLSSIKWCCYIEYAGTCYWNKIHSITFYYNDKESGTPSILYHCSVNDIYYHIEAINFLKSLGLIVANGQDEGKAQEEKYRKLLSETFYNEHKEEIEIAKKNYEKKMEWRKKNIWPIAKWCLIGFYSLFGVCVLAVLFGII